jgi:glycosyltransferase involved in cell wall biosynthesis
VGLSILHVAQPTVDGVARCVTDLAADQIRRGHEVVVACPADGWLGEHAEAVGARHVTWPAGRSPGPASALETFRLARIARSEAPDLVHLFQPHAWSFFADQGRIGAVAASWERRATRWTDVIVCVSRGEELAGRAAGVDGDLRVLPNGIDLEAFASASPGEREQARERLGLGSAPLAVCVGRLSEQKGQDVLVDAWPQVVSEVPGAELVLVGTGPDEETLRTRVPVTGEVANVRDWLVAANVVVQPSRWEGLPYTVLEAMATARAVVATEVAGMADALGDEAALVAVDDRAALVREIGRRLLDGAASDEEGRMLRERVERHFDLRATTQAMVDLYGEVLERRRAQ